MKCENCNQEYNGVYGSGRFCTAKCARSFSTKKNREEINKKVSKSLLGREGHNKGKKFGKISKERSKNISNSLKKAAREKKEKNQKELPFTEWSKAWQRDFIFNEVGNRCEKCGYDIIDKKLGRGPFEIHHIDGNPKNNERENLQVLCANCHWLTDNWGFRNKNKSECSIKKMIITSFKIGKIFQISNKTMKLFNVSSLEEFIKKYINN
jgi:hypothetical protein